MSLITTSLKQRQHSFLRNINNSYKLPTMFVLYHFHFHHPKPLYPFLTSTTFLTLTST